VETFSTLGDLLLKRYVVDFISQMQSISSPLYGVITGNRGHDDRLVVWTDGEWGVVHNEPYWALAHRHSDGLNTVVTLPDQCERGGLLIGEHLKEHMVCVNCKKDVPQEVRVYYGIFIMDVPEEDCFPRMPR
jgi:hypothetical protein